jgi:hypothetical protein
MNPAPPVIKYVFISVKIGVKTKGAGNAEGILSEV